MERELRNLPHIAGMAFNAPLLLEPAYARVFFCALAGQMGISRLTDAVTGISLGHEQLMQPGMLFGDDDDDIPYRPPRPYQVVDGIAVLPVSGTLVGKTASLKPYSGMTGYNGIVARLQQAIGDPDVEGVMLDMDTPGGMVAGAFDCADVIARLREIKPIWALANDMNCSAGQLIASAASHRLVTQTAKTGSIGVMMAHSNYGAALKDMGVEITLIYSGDHKVDGNPYEKLPKEVRADFQSKIDATRQMFADKVAEYTALSVEAVIATQAAVYSGREAVDIGLADEVVINTDALGVMRDALDQQKKITSGGMMEKENATAQQPAAAEQETEKQVAAAVDPAEGADVSAQIAAAVQAEGTRITGILNCEEAKDRGGLAQALAETPGMSLNDAQRILAAAPKDAQFRTDTALDKLMEAYAPGFVGAAADTADDNDLMDIPV